MKTVERSPYLDTAPLTAGDTVALVSPAGPGNEESLQRAVGYYESWGLRVRVGVSALTPHPRAKYLAGPDEDRRRDLVDAWLDPEVDAVVAVRGGYGALRLLDGIDWERMRGAAARRDGRPKLLTGSSDITALHEAFRAHLDLPTLFCPMPGTNVFRDSEFIRDDVRRWLFEPWEGRELIGPKTEIMVAGRAEGTFTGGNLSLLAAAMGAPESSAPPSGILFLEDITEEPYRLDGFLTQLRRGGRLAAASGVVLGSWHECGDVDLIHSLMRDEFGHAAVPVLWEQGFGHDPNALSIPLGVDGVLDASGDQPRLTVGRTA
ncbi:MULTISPECIES: LD-carboxypeptidase [unclassified Microbacterium]|uniref:S66 peptidase family protein n=1 Tax=unclassified Microbacterium TaxID=2609290 RepID=UPI000EAA5762|nr:MULTISPECIES: LD-carboxypeptidase [unclassified Microbacterium]MBT2486266.1 LD-carboxypeptidase [Microbacterium sp. ISL-108]RKN68981.1 LD-carboxypeptidase [Microbacterium sp. CGR2]